MRAESGGGGGGDRGGRLGGGWWEVLKLPIFARGALAHESQVGSSGLHAAVSAGGAASRRTQGKGDQVAVVGGGTTSAGPQQQVEQHALPRAALGGQPQKRRGEQVGRAQQERSSEADAAAAPLATPRRAWRAGRRGSSGPTAAKSTAKRQKDGGWDVRRQWVKRNMHCCWRRSRPRAVRAAGSGVHRRAGVVVRPKRASPREALPWRTRC